MKNYAKLTDGRLEWAPSLIREEGFTISNPSAERLTALGYKPVVYDRPAEAPDGNRCEVYTEEADCIRVGWEPCALVPEPAPAYELRVEALIRRRYTLSDELAILRQREAKPEEFGAYYDYCEACKAEAKRETTQ